ncbi:hypothetical protein GCM10017771_05230 [Streptomyces capitiformicae]|uniref:Uncharacterized protein n=2 Tax=Streptomyces capitiformicae TaxID=2014920 RepID=A0A919L484_9ACTN|nr:hypothetical protein [Streptomyces capitiformicae]GHH82061.1 hypothetical protein GCM10017771_05230 [Streptomyces capitiformicae]
MTEIDFEEAMNCLKLVLAIDAWTESQVILQRPINLDTAHRIDRLEVAEIRSAMERANAARGLQGAEVNWGTSFEVMVVRNATSIARMGFSIRAVEETSSFDENGLKFSIGDPSLEFSLSVLREIKEGNQARRANFLRTSRNRRDLQIYLSPDNVKEMIKPGAPLARGIVGAILPIITLKIESAKPRSDFREISEAFLFQLAYNFDVSYRVADNLEHLVSSGRVRRRGRAADAAMDAPRMTYKSDLVHHYQLAVSADSPMLQYLSYYHIAEHFFERVFNDDFVEQVRRKIADPAFSLKRAKDIQGVIKLISSTQRKVRDEGGVDEQRALNLVLEKYVDLPRLASELHAHDSDLLDYYKKQSPSFSENVTVDLANERESEVKSALAKRIYQTRNSLVHAKDGARPRYFPFVNDAELAREVPLLRFCAEHIIIENGKVI